MHGGDPDGVPTDHPGDTPDVTPDDLQGGDLDAALADLIPRSFRGLRRRIHARLEEGDLPPHQARALRLLDRDGAMRPGELARCLRIAPRSATEVVDGLAERGLVRRRPDPGDRRAMLVEVTAAAAAALARTEALRRDAIGDYTGAMSQADRRELVRLLSLLVKADDDSSRGAARALCRPRPRQASDGSASAGS